MAKRQAAKRRAWNKGVEIGQKGALTPDQVRRIRQVLARRGGSGLRDLALFSVAIDTMLHGPELLNLTVKDVQRPDGAIRSVIKIARPRRRPPSGSKADMSAHRVRCQQRTYAVQQKALTR
jgi:integrase